jgi:hypothetical protein
MKGENITVQKLQDVSFFAVTKAAALSHTKAQLAATFRDNCGDTSSCSP